MIAFIGVLMGRLIQLLIVISLTGLAVFSICLWFIFLFTDPNGDMDKDEKGDKDD